MVTVASLIMPISVMSEAGTVGRERPRVAVVLGGGAARGLSHIGLLQSLAEEGIPVDVLVGTSMGSIVAGLHAAGLSIDNLEYLVQNVNLADLFRPNLPIKGGVVDTERFTRFIDDITDGATFDDAHIDFYSVITRLDTGDELGLHHGPISRAIVASMSIPGMFPPVEVDGNFYVDGGMKSPVPVDFTRQLDVDVIIAVDARRTLEHIDHDQLLTNLQLTLFFLLDANTEWQVDLADVVIAPDVQSDSYMDYDRAPYFIAEGYRATKEVVPQIREILLGLDPDFPFGDRPPPEGISPDVFANRIKSALEDVSASSGGVSMTPAPTLQFSPGQPFLLKLGVDFPIGDRERSSLGGFYAFQGRGSDRIHTIGMSTRLCRSICVGLFARRGTTDEGWSAGVGAAGLVVPSVHYRVEWEPMRSGPPAWRAQIKSPTADALMVRKREYLFEVNHDPRGVYNVYNAPGEAVTARAMFRMYFPGEVKNIMELVRGTAAWYVGVGARAEVSNQPIDVTPMAEVGVLMEGRLFGLYPMRTRLSLHYVGEDDPWVIRWTFGE